MVHSPGQRGLRSEVSPLALPAPPVEKEVRGTKYMEHDQQLVLKILGDVHSKVTKNTIETSLQCLVVICKCKID